MQAFPFKHVPVAHLNENFLTPIFAQNMLAASVEKHYYCEFFTKCISVLT